MGSNVVGRVNLAQPSGQWYSLVNTAIKLSVTQGKKQITIL